MYWDVPAKVTKNYDLPDKTDVTLGGAAWTAEPTTSTKAGAHIECRVYAKCVVNMKCWVEKRTADRVSTKCKNKYMRSTTVFAPGEYLECGNGVRVGDTHPRRTPRSVARWRHTAGHGASPQRHCHGRWSFAWLPWPPWVWRWKLIGEKKTAIRKSLYCLQSIFFRFSILIVFFACECHT